MTVDRRTLEDEIAERREARPDASAALPERYPCPVCNELRRPFEIVDVTDVPEIKADMACTQCLIGVDRHRTQRKEKAERAKLPPWQTPEGEELKALRDRTLNRWRWTVARDSPLSEGCQLAFLAFLKAWHRMTVDAASPAAFIEPPLPAMEYAPAPAAASQGKKG